MRKIIFAFLFIQISVFSGFSQKDYTLTYNSSKNNSYEIDFNLLNWNVTQVQKNGVNYNQIIFYQNTVTEQKGWAELPFVSASIQLSPQKNVDLHIVSTAYQDILLEYPLLPSRGTIYNGQDPNQILYIIDDASKVDEFYPKDIAFSETPFILRDMRGVSVRIFPFQWNAATKTLRVYTQISIELKENSTHVINPLLNISQKPIQEAIGLYKSIFLNFNEKKYDLKTADYGDILVVTTARDEAAIEPYITWKKEKGYNVAKEVVPQGSIVKDLIQEKYNENSQLMYVLLVGDWEDIQSEGFTFEGIRCPNDPMLGCVAGDDNFPDLAVGRMSAKNPDQVRVQVEKTIQYEKTPDSDTKWRETFIGIGSNQGTGVGDDNETDSTHIQRIYEERLDSFTYQYHKRNYGHNIPVSTLIKQINDGASTIAYCGHGTETAWFTTGFDNTGINNLKNGDKIPFIVSTACLNGAFHKSNDCFAETWLRKEHGGALVTWMSAITQPWTPPQRGQDYFYDLLIGGFDYSLHTGQNGINTHEQRTHWGSITTNVFALMLTESSATGDLNTVKSWITFGDPSVQLRTKKPDVITSSWNSLMQGKHFETIITTNGIPVQNALVALSQNGIYKKALTDENGKVSIEHAFEVGEVLLVVTAFNTTTIYKSIPCVASGYSFIACEDMEIHDSNRRLDYNDGNVKVNFIVRNIGTVDADNLKITINTNDPYITIIDNEESLLAIAAQEKVVLEDAFEIKVSNTIPDKHIVTFNYSITGSETWSGTFNMEAHAAILENYAVVINDYITGNNNNQLDAGETALINIQLINKGSAEATHIKGKITSNDPYLSILTTDEQYWDDITEKDNTSRLDFLVKVSPNVPLGYEMHIDVLVEADAGISKTFPVTIRFSDAYCKPTANCQAYNDAINGFSLNTIENENSGCSPDGYGDFTAMRTTLKQGNTYDATITTLSNLQNISLWIDFNANNTFDESEMLINNYKIAAAGTQVVPITIPQTVINGEYRLRIRSVFKESSVNPCNNAANGETEDYTVVIDNGLTLPEPTNLQAVQNGNYIHLQWNAPATSLNYSYVIFRNNTYLGVSSQASFVDSNIMNGRAHIYTVKTVYNEGVSDKFAGPVTVMISYHEAPKNVYIEKNGSHVAITWDAIQQANLKGYNIYRNNLKINSQLISGNHFEDSLITENMYCYQVSAVYNDGFEAKSEVQCVQHTGINNILKDEDVKIYPNPASDFVQIVCDEIPQSLRIFNMQGVVVYTGLSKSKSQTLSVSSWRRGVYIIEIQTGKYKLYKKLMIL